MFIFSHCHAAGPEQQEFELGGLKHNRISEPGLAKEGSGHSIVPREYCLLNYFEVPKNASLQKKQENNPLTAPN